MKERPVIFTADEVRAALAGRMAQFTRPITPQPEVRYVAGWGIGWSRHPNTWTEMHHEQPSPADLAVFSARLLAHCPYGQAGDHLWVKETWKQIGDQVWFRAGMDGEQTIHGTRFIPISNWHSSIYMPRRIARLVLEVTSVRVEQASWAWVVEFRVIGGA